MTFRSYLILRKGERGKWIEFEVSLLPFKEFCLKKKKKNTKENFYCCIKWNFTIVLTTINVVLKYFLLTHWLKFFCSSWAHIGWMIQEKNSKCIVTTIPLQNKMTNKMLLIICTHRNVTAFRDFAFFLLMTLQ